MYYSRSRSPGPYRGLSYSNYSSDLTTRNFSPRNRSVQRVLDTDFVRPDRSRSPVRDYSTPVTRASNLRSLPSELTIDSSPVLRRRELGLSSQLVSDSRGSPVNWLSGDDYSLGTKPRSYYDFSSTPTRFTTFTPTTMIRPPKRIDYSDYLRPAMQSRPMLKTGYTPRPRSERETDAMPIVRERKLIKFREITNDILNKVKRKVSWDLPEEIQSPLINEMRNRESPVNDYSVTNTVRSRDNSLTRYGSKETLNRESSLTSYSPKDPRSRDCSSSRRGSSQRTDLNTDCGSPTSATRRSSDHSIGRMSPRNLMRRLKEFESHTSSNLDVGDSPNINADLDATGSPKIVPPPRKKSLGSLPRIKKHRRSSLENTAMEERNINYSIIADKIRRSRESPESPHALKSQDLPAAEVSCVDEKSNEVVPGVTEAEIRPYPHRRRRRRTSNDTLDQGNIEDVKPHRRHRVRSELRDTSVPQDPISNPSLNEAPRPLNRMHRKSVKYKLEKSLHRRLSKGSEDDVDQMPALSPTVCRKDSLPNEKNETESTSLPKHTPNEIKPGDDRKELSMLGGDKSSKPLQSRSGDKLNQIKERKLVDVEKKIETKTVEGFQSNLNQSARSLDATKISNANIDAKRPVIPCASVVASANDALDIKKMPSNKIPSAVCNDSKVKIASSKTDVLKSKSNAKNEMNSISAALKPSNITNSSSSKFLNTASETTEISSVSLDRKVNSTSNKIEVPPSKPNIKNQINSTPTKTSLPDKSTNTSPDTDKLLNKTLSNNDVVKPKPPKPNEKFDKSNVGIESKVNSNSSKTILLQNSKIGVENKEIDSTSSTAKLANTNSNNNKLSSKISSNNNNRDNLKALNDTAKSMNSRVDLSANIDTISNTIEEPETNPAIKNKIINSTSPATIMPNKTTNINSTKDKLSNETSSNNAEILNTSKSNEKLENSTVDVGIKARSIGIKLNTSNLKPDTKIQINSVQSPVPTPDQPTVPSKLTSDKLSDKTISNNNAVKLKSSKAVESIEGSTVTLGAKINSTNKTQESNSESIVKKHTEYTAPIASKPSLPSKPSILSPTKDKPLEKIILTCNETKLKTAKDSDNVKDLPTDRVLLDTNISPSKCVNTDINTSGIKKQMNTTSIEIAVSDKSSINTKKVSPKAVLSDLEKSKTPQYSVKTEIASLGSNATIKETLSPKETNKNISTSEKDPVSSTRPIITTPTKLSTESNANHKLLNKTDSSDKRQMKGMKCDTKSENTFSDPMKMPLHSKVLNEEPVSNKNLGKRDCSIMTTPLKPSDISISSCKDTSNLKKQSDTALPAVSLSTSNRNDVSKTVLNCDAEKIKTSEDSKLIVSDGAKNFPPKKIFKEEEIVVICKLPQPKKALPIAKPVISIDANKIIPVDQNIVVSIVNSKTVLVSDKEPGQKSKIVLDQLAIANKQSLPVSKSSPTSKEICISDSGNKVQNRAPHSIDKASPEICVVHTVVLKPKCPSSDSSAKQMKDESKTVVGAIRLKSIPDVIQSAVKANNTVQHPNDPDSLKTIVLPVNSFVEKSSVLPNIKTESGIDADSTKVSSSPSQLHFTQIPDLMKTTETPLDRNKIPSKLLEKDASRPELLSKKAIDISHPKDKLMNGTLNKPDLIDIKSVPEESGNKTVTVNKKYLVSNDSSKVPSNETKASNTVHVGNSNANIILENKNTIPSKINEFKTSAKPVDSKKIASEAVKPYKKSKTVPNLIAVSPEKACDISERDDTSNSSATTRKENIASMSSSSIPSTLLETKKSNINGFIGNRAPEMLKAAKKELSELKPTLIKNSEIAKVSPDIKFKKLEDDKLPLVKDDIKLNKSLGISTDNRQNIAVAPAPDSHVVEKTKSGEKLSSSPDLIQKNKYKKIEKPPEDSVTETNKSEKDGNKHSIYLNKSVAPQSPDVCCTTIGNGTKVAQSKVLIVAPEPTTTKKDLKFEESDEKKHIAARDTQHILRQKSDTKEVKLSDETIQKEACSSNSDLSSKIAAKDNHSTGGTLKVPVNSDSKTALDALKSKIEPDRQSKGLTSTITTENIKSNEITHSAKANTTSNKCLTAEIINTSPSAIKTSETQTGQSKVAAENLSSNKRNAEPTNKGFEMDINGNSSNVQTLKTGQPPVKESKVKSVEETTISKPAQVKSNDNSANVKERHRVPKAAHVEPVSFLRRPPRMRFGLFVRQEVDVVSSSSDSDSSDSEASTDSDSSSASSSETEVLRAAVDYKFKNVKFPDRAAKNSTRSNTSIKSSTSSGTTTTSYSTSSNEDSPKKRQGEPQKLRFRKYGIDDFVFLKLLGKGSFGKVLLAELKGHDMYFAIKCLKKDVVLEDDDVEGTMIERRVLALGTQHPYMCKLYCTFQTKSYLFFVMEYLNGGDLMFHIQNAVKFDVKRAMFYGAEIVSALKFLHKRGIVYRDIKLDNVMLDKEGHIRLVDFGMCQCRIYLEEAQPFNFCGTPTYIAPEIILGQTYNQSVDWWSFGVLLFEMLVGRSPFIGTDEDELYWSICNEEPKYPRFLPKDALNILENLLIKSPVKRLGMPSSAAGEIKDHAFFSTIDWDKLEKKQLPPPFVPLVLNDYDTSNFDSLFTMDSATLSPVDSEILASMDQEQFHGFSYTNPHITG